MAYDADAAMAPYAKFAGAIMIAAGFGMTFYGAKFILWVIGFPYLCISTRNLFHY